jgi:hypothetical protein
MKNRFLIFLLINTIVSSCITKFDYESETNELLLVVDAKLTQKNTPHELFLKYSNSYGTFDPNPVLDARITLFDDQGNFEEYVEDFNGRYIFYGNKLRPGPGNSYYIEIELFNKKIYRSRPQIMPEVMKPEKLYFELVKVDEINDLQNISLQRYLNIYINTPVKRENQNYYFNWRVDHTYSFTELQCHPLHTPAICYIKRKFENDNIKTFSSENLNGGLLEGFRVASIKVSPNWEFFEKHFFNVAQHSITRETYDYWETVKKVSQSTGSIFDIPPAPIYGNIYNIQDPEERVLGLFEVSAVDTIRTYTFAQDLEPLAVVDRCSILDYRSYRDPACCSCLSIPDSELERPYYWGFLHDE